MRRSAPHRRPSSRTLLGAMLAPVAFVAGLTATANASANPPAHRPSAPHYTKPYRGTAHHVPGKQPFAPRAKPLHATAAADRPNTAAKFPNDGIAARERIDGANPAEVDAVGSQPSGAYSVDPATGWFSADFTDISLDGRGPAMTIARRYESGEADSDSLFGHGWNSVVTMHLIQANDTVNVTQEDGTQLAFADNGTGYSPVRPRMLATLVHNDDGTWTFTRRGSQIFTFDTAGTLTTIADRNGNTVTLHYTDGALDQVLSSNGRFYAVSTVDGRINTITDGDGRSTEYSYDADGNLTQVIEPDDATWKYGYGDGHLLQSITEPTENVTSSSTFGEMMAPMTIGYDASGRVVSQSDFRGLSTAYDYGSIPGATKVSDADGDVTAYWYDNGLPSKTTVAYGKPGAATTKYLSYDPDFLAPTEIVDARGKHWKYTYDGNGFLRSTTDPLGRTKSYSYDDHGDLLSETDPASGAITSNQYDDSGNLLSTQTPLLDSDGNTVAVRTTSYAYTSTTNFGLPTSITSPNGATTHLNYNRFGDLTVRTSPATAAAPSGARTTWAYDLNTGWPTYTVSPRGYKSGNAQADFITAYNYDDDGRLKFVTDPLYDPSNPNKHQTVYRYDADGNLRKLTDGDGNTTRYDHNADDELTMIERADGTTISQTWTGTGKLLTRTNDALDRTTTYGYNGRDELVSVTDPMQQVTRYGRDLTGNLTSIATPGSSCSGRISGGCVTRSYDDAGELSGVTYHDGATPNVTDLNYDADGRLVAETDGSGTSSWVYDSLGRLIDSTDGSKAHTSYGYDLDGNTTSITYPSGRTVTRHFDTVDELDSINDGSGNVTAFGYDVDGNLTQTTYPADTGEIDRNVYLRTDALETITDKGRNGTLATFAYTRDGTNRVNATTATGADPDVQAYRYDSLHELTGSGAAGRTIGYGYDPAGDITTYGQDAGTSQTQMYNADGELCWSSTAPVDVPGCAQAPVESVSYNYDAAGDRAAMTTSTAGAVSIDTRVSNESTFGSMVTTKAFDTSGPDTLLALVSSNGRSKQTTTVGGARLNWRLVARANGRGGTAEIWTATAPQALRGVRVWAKQQQTPYDQSLTVVALKHADGVGASAHASGKSGAPSVTLTSTAKGSMTFAAGHDPDSADRRQISSGHARMHEFQDKAAKTDEWAERTKTITDKVGKTVTVADARPKSDRWDMAAAEVVPAPVLHTTTYGYDAAGNLTSIAPPSGTGDKFRYDAAGLRTSESGRASATFTWDTRGTSARLLSDGARTFVYGPDGLALEQIGPHGGVVWLHHGQVGNTRLLTDRTGAVVGTYSYGPYGQPVAHTGTASTPLQFGGGYTDASSGLIYLQQRYYEPATAQFLSAATGTTRPDEPYAYAVADPVNTVEPSGAGVHHPYARSARAWLDVTETSPRCAPTAPSCGPSGAG